MSLLLLWVHHNLTPLRPRLALVLRLAVHRLAVQLPVVSVRRPAVASVLHQPAVLHLAAMAGLRPLHRLRPIRTVLLLVHLSRRLPASLTNRSTRSAERWWLIRERSIPTANLRKAASVVLLHKLAVLVVATAVLRLAVHTGVATAHRIRAVLLRVVVTVALRLVVHKAAVMAVLLKVAPRRAATAALRRAATVVLRLVVHKAEVMVVLRKVAATARRPAAVTAVLPLQLRWAATVACPVVARRWCKLVVAVPSDRRETRSWCS